MGTFSFYKDIKNTIWRREYYSVDAESEEEAVNKILNDKVEMDDSEFIYETEEYMDPDENRGYSTIEIYDNITDDLTYTNSHVSNCG